MNTTIHGALSVKDKAALRELSEGCKFVVDLGTFCGASAAIFAEKAEKVITIDLFEDFRLIENDDSLDHYAKLFDAHPHDYEFVKNKLSAWQNITVLKGYTWEFAVGHKNVDLVFIDGDHSKEGVSKDFLAWFSSVKKDGIIAFHDYGVAPWDGVKEFIDNFVSKVPQLKFIGLNGSVSAWRKVGDA